jgi:hypothetical protein
MTAVTLHLVEVNQMCQIMILLLRCSANAAVYSMQSIGSELVLLLFSILLKTDIGRDTDSPIRILIKRIAGIEVSLPNMPASERVVTFLEQMALLGNENNVVSWEALVMLVGLTVHPDSKLYVMESRTFLNSVIKCGQQVTKEYNNKDQVARLLQNLTVHGNNKAKMTEKLIVGALLSMASPMESIVTRIHAIQSLKQISVEAKGKLYIVAFEGGKALKAILCAATEKRLQAVVVETLLSLTCKCTATPMTNHPGLVDTLTFLVRVGNALVAEKAAQVTKRLSTHICMTQKGHQALLEAILFMSESKSRRVLHWMAKAMLEQSRLSGSSFLLVRAQEPLLKICALASDECLEVRGPAVEALLSLSTYHSNLKRLSSNDKVLDTLVKTVETGIRDRDGLSSGATRDAIICILNFVTHCSSRKRVAKHVGIVSCLSKYGISHDMDDELKKAALHGVIVLSPLM